MYECNECKHRFKDDGTPTHCPECGSPGVQVLPQKGLSEENRLLEQRRQAEERATGRSRTEPQAVKPTYSARLGAPRSDVSAQIPRRAAEAPKIEQAPGGGGASGT